MSSALQIVDLLLTSLTSSSTPPSSSSSKSTKSCCSSSFSSSLTMATKSDGRAANFSAGPSALPESALLEAQKDLMNYKGSGMSVMEMSHRSQTFGDIWNTAMSDLRDLLKVPPNYQILFLQGGATTQFSAVPLNLNLRLGCDGRPADYAVTGAWSAKAATEAQKYGNVNIVCDTKDSTYTTIPPIEDWKLSEDASYLHLCINETVHGVTMSDIPDSKTITCPIIADFSSCFMSEPIDVSRFAVIYAGAQKNIGPAGLTVVIVRDDLLGKDKCDPLTPLYLDWTVQSSKNSMYNTPPCWSAYMAGLVFQWLKSLGGLDVMQLINQRKAAMLYDCIDGSEGFYVAPVDKSVRSLMNVRFNIQGGNPELEKKFISEASEIGIENIKGHRSVGALRASIYNAQPIENIQMLIQFMKDFQSANSS